MKHSTAQKIRALSVFFLVISAAAQEESIATARKLALAGHRSDAEAILVKRLSESPKDTDARTLYGTVLSWDGNYSEARKQLDQVLTESPGNGDAMQAMASVELATDHPDKARDLLIRILKERPNDTDLLYADARALIRLKEPSEAANVLSHLLEIDPGNKDAIRLREGLGLDAPVFDVSIEEYSDRYSNGIGNQFESQIALKGITPVGAVVERFSSAVSFGHIGSQMDIDFYPAFRKGTYAYLNLGFSPDHNIYPEYRFGADIFQTLGYGFEGTVGYRRLGFSPKVNIATAALTKYYGPWLFTARGFFSPNTVGTSQSMQLIGRRYLAGSAGYLQFRFGYGSTPTEIVTQVDIGILKSTSYDLMLHKMVGKRWYLDAEFGGALEDRVGNPRVRHLNSNLGAGFRF